MSFRCERRSRPAEARRRTAHRRAGPSASPCRARAAAPAPPARRRSGPRNARGRTASASTTSRTSASSAATGARACVHRPALALARRLHRAHRPRQLGHPAPAAHPLAPSSSGAPRGASSHIACWNDSHVDLVRPRQPLQLQAVAQRQLSRRHERRRQRRLRAVLAREQLVRPYERLQPAAMQRSEPLAVLRDGAGHGPRTRRRRPASRPRRAPRALSTAASSAARADGASSTS